MEQLKVIYWVVMSTALSDKSEAESIFLYHFMWIYRIATNINPFIHEQVNKYEQYEKKHEIHHPVICPIRIWHIKQPH